MPFPEALTRFNKHVTNKVFLLFAGWIPPLAVVEHHGRLSGSRYRTPIMAFPSDGGYVFALTYGRNVDWVKNLLASGVGSLEHFGSEFPVHSFSFISFYQAINVFPFWVRVFLQLLSVKDCLIAKKGSSGTRA